MTILIVIIAVIVAVSISGVLIFAFVVLNHAIPVRVTSTDYVSSTDVCGMNGRVGYPLAGPTGATISVTFAVTNPNATSSCTIAGLAASTTGFVITSANLPLTIPAASSGSLDYSVRLPSSAYMGPLTIVVS